MEDIIGKISLFMAVFTGALLLLFLGFDLGIFGEGVKITGFYYIFMGALFSVSLYLYLNKSRFKNF